jgi:hypothetical protein
MPMSIEEKYAAAEAFDASLTPEQNFANARAVRAAWVEQDVTTFAVVFPKLAALIDAADKESK